MVRKAIKTIHRCRRNIFFMCLGSILAQLVMLLPDIWQLAIVSLITGLFFGSAFTLFYYIKKGMFK